MYELASKEIAELFLGDKEINMYIDEVYVRYSMPNLTHSDINSLAPSFGINNIDTVNTYNRTDKMSWLIKQCHDLDKENKLLKYFVHIFLNCLLKKMDLVYSPLIHFLVKS